MSYPEAMPNKYTLDKDLSDRLDSTICRYDGKPVFIRHSDTARLTIYEPIGPGEQIKKIKPDDPLLDISMIELGYFNHMHGSKKCVFYSKRSTNKKWRQGVCAQVLQYEDIMGTHHPLGASTPYTPGFYSMLSGDYPTFQEAIAFLKTGYESVAISKDVAMKRLDVGITLLFCRGENVAWMDPEDQQVHLNKNDRTSWVIERILSRFPIKVMK